MIAADRRGTSRVLSRGNLMGMRSFPLMAAACVMALLPVSRPAAAQETAAAPVASPGLSTMRPGDVIRIRVWREPDMSGDFTVDERGIAVLPRVGPMQVSDVSVTELKDRIRTEFERYLQPGLVEVTTLHRVRVVGAVRTPGLYPVDQTMSMADVVALAGGTTPAGKNEVVLMRDGARVGPVLSLAAPLAQTPLRSGDHLLVPERSFISRHPGIILGSISTAISVYWILNRK